MTLTIQCDQCKAEVSVGGSIEEDTNATIIDEDDPAWDEACEHIKAGGAYTITASSYDDDIDPEMER